VTFLDGSLRLGSGDSNFTASVAPVVVQRVGGLVVPSRANGGATVTFTAWVIFPGGPVPTGSVTISDVTNGAKIYGVAPLNSGVGESLRSNRDLAMIAILLGCGLRRAELASLRMEDVQIRQGHWAIVDLVGKGGHVRTVPMPNWVKGAVDKWTAAAQVTHGRIFRAVSRHGSTWGRGISENVVWYVVRSCARRLELEHLAPHISVERAPSYAIQMAGNLSKSSFFSGTPLF
jgi:hypothetical protein